MAVFWKILACLLLPLIWGLGVEFVFESIRRRRAAGGRQRDGGP